MEKQPSDGPIDMEAALSDPSLVFASPNEVVADRRLSRQQKLEILRRWEYDAVEQQVAQEEGMPGNGTDLLAQILSALDELTGGFDVQHVGPTKQHGLP